MMHKHSDSMLVAVLTFTVATLLVDSNCGFSFEKRFIANKSLMSPAPTTIEKTAAREQDSSTVELEEVGLFHHTATTHELNHQPTRSSSETSGIPQYEQLLHLYGIRHAVSVANEFMSREGNQWGDATFCDDLALRDAPLSAGGREQATMLSNRLIDQVITNVADDNNNNWFSKVELIVLSPLTRCLETWKLGVQPAVAACKAMIDDYQEPTVVILPLLTERVYTASDTGTCLAELKRKWSSDTICWNEADQFCANDDATAWWYHVETGMEIENPEWRPHGDGQWYAVPGEPMDVFHQRMKRLKNWLLARPEKYILIVSHWGVFDHFTGQEIENCGICNIGKWQKAHERIQ